MNLKEGMRLHSKLKATREIYKQAMDDLVAYLNKDEVREHATKCLRQAMDEYGIPYQKALLGMDNVIEWKEARGYYEGWIVPAKIDLTHQFESFEECEKFEKRFLELMGLPDDPRCYDVFAGWKEDNN